MSNVILNKSPFLRTSRSFPQEAQPLSIEIDRSYIDIANAVNQREISIYPVGNAVLTGQTWFIQGGNLRRDGFRQVYTFTAAGNIAHGLNLSRIYAFTAIYGTFYDGTSYYPLPYVNVAAVNNQVSVTVNATNIVITAGGGAPPAITSGLVVLEWLSNP